jgi:para-nitrobenzyl esterase
MKALTKIADGSLAGDTSSDGAVARFKGIPYAKPPVADLRWRPPQRPTPWSGTRQAVQFGPGSIQVLSPKNSFYHMNEGAMSEDCLYLNVYTGGLDPAERRPVIVWFHFGAFNFGWSGSALFDGTELARKGAVIVTVNYRLGRMGFLAHPALSAESKFHASGNYGLMDQIAALTWIRENIAAFGGDPGCVTIYGVSAGSFSVSALMASPLAKGLFHRAIGGSGGAFGPVSEDNSRIGDYSQSLKAAEHAGATLMAGFGAATAQQMRALPVEPLLTIDLSQPGPGFFDSAYPLIDGYVLPVDPYRAFTGGQYNDVPLITGSSANEIGPFFSDTETYLQVSRTLIGDSFERFIALFPAGPEGQTMRSSGAGNGDRLFTWQNWTWARLHARHGRNPVYYYHFAHASPVPANRYLEQSLFPNLGAVHTSELPYVFRNLAARDWPWSPTERELSDLMSGYWLEFARNGNPNGGSRPAWPKFVEADGQMMSFEDGAVARSAPSERLRERLAFWDDFFAKERARQLPASVG